MLLEGGTMLAEPCHYCGGVRVMKDGRALCAGCGREPEEREVPEAPERDAGPEVRRLSSELAEERDPERQRQILARINALLGA